MIKPFMMTLLSLILLAVGCAGQRIARVGPVANGGIAHVIPAEGRVVGFLEYVDVNIVPEVAGERVHRGLSDIVLEGPSGRVSCDIEDKASGVRPLLWMMEGADGIEMAGWRLKLVPKGTHRVKPTSYDHHRDEYTLAFAGTSVACEVIQGPDGRAFDWTVDGNAKYSGLFDLYCPTRWASYGRYGATAGHNDAFWDQQLVVGGLPNGKHLLKMSKGRLHPDAQPLHRSMWIEASIGKFLVSPLEPGRYSVKVIARSSSGKELGRQQSHFFIDPKLSQGLKAYIHSSAYANIFSEGESPVWTVTVVNDGRRSQTVEPSIELLDFWGQTYELPSVHRKVVAGATERWHIRWPRPDPGWYLCRMTLRMNDGRILTVREVTASITPNASDRILGSTPMEGVYDRGLNGVMDEAPEQLWRIYQLGGIEYDHSTIKPRVENIEKVRPFNLVPGMASGAGGYATRDWTNVPKAIKITRDHPVNHNAAQYIKGWRHTVDDEANTFAATSYQNVAAGQRIAALALHGPDPQAKLTPTQVGAWHDVDFFFELHKQGAWPDVHFLNTHVYFQDPPWLLDALNLYDWMQRMIPQRPMILGLWNTANSSSGNPVSPHPFDQWFLRVMHDQAIRGFHQRRYIRRYEWVEKLWHWNAYDYFENPHHSVLFWNKTPKPIYNVIAAMTWKLNGSTYIGPLDLPDASVKAEVFSRRGKAVVILWSTEQVNVTLDMLAGPVTVTDLMGRFRTVQTNTFEVGPNPIYIEPTDSPYIKQAKLQAERIDREKAYWNKHAIVVVQGPGRGPRTEKILQAGHEMPLQLWVSNEGDKPLRGKMSLARETSEGFWYGGVLEVPEDDREDFTFKAQPFDVAPSEQAPVVFTIAARPNARTSNVTLRTKTYVKVGQHEVFLDPTTINMIVIAQQKVE